MRWFGLSLLGILAACSNGNKENVVSQRFVHKYGFVVNESEWKERDQDGKIEQILDTGVHVVKNYENGVLHGITTHSFPYSATVEKEFAYDQGELLKETTHDRQGVPIVQHLYEYDGRKVLTHWDSKGAPIRIEEYEGDKLIKGTYFNPMNEIEAQITDGTGTRYKRDREGLLLVIDEFKNSDLVHRSTYHPNGHVHMDSYFSSYQLHGDQKIYSPNGQLYLQTQWEEGLLNGIKISYRNGTKFQETPYVLGQKEGIEKMFDEQENLLSEISYLGDLKHGLTTYYTKGQLLSQEWYYQGHAVNEEKFDALTLRDEMIAQMDEEF